MSIKIFVNKLMRPIRIFLHKKNIIPQACYAYEGRFPLKIKVRWFRDGKYIIGHVSYGDKEFVTQGKNADEFIEMVNDAMITVCNVPKNYVDVLSNFYKPPKKEMEKLRDENVTNSIFGFTKVKKIHQLA